MGMEIETLVARLTHALIMSLLIFLWPAAEICRRAEGLLLPFMVADFLKMMTHQMKEFSRSHVVCHSAIIKMCRGVNTPLHIIIDIFVRLSCQTFSYNGFFPFVIIFWLLNGTVAGSPLFTSGNVPGTVLVNWLSLWAWRDQCLYLR